jgi:hypothetical protein
MIVTVPALLIALSGFQDPVAAPLPSQALYEAPAIRPFEPPASFEANEPEGDNSTGTYRGPIRGVVLVNAYEGQFEAGPTDAALAYDQGVVSAEMRMDQRMGPMDGAWQLVDPEGTVLMALVLTDFGPGLPIEGAWMSRTTPGAGTLTSGSRDGDTVSLLLIGQGAAEGGRLELQRVGRGWSGTLQGERRRLNVSLVPKPD